MCRILAGPTLLGVQTRHRLRLNWSRTDTTQQSRQTADKEADLNHSTVYVSAYTETDPTGMLSPNNGRLSGPNKVGLFRADCLARHLLQFA